ncbi:MAG: 4Fe-4S binding protein [Candidatus Zixiibacteriota bacterium]
MNKEDLAFHYVCTREEARQLVGQYERFWVLNCGCREARKEGCSRSRIDLCLMFRSDITGSDGSGKKEISRAELEEIFQEARDKHLVTRPFRNDKDRSQTEGICFCCDDCCAYFLDPTEKCDKGELIEKTEQDNCTNCGECVEVCYFKARKMEEDKLQVDQKECYGCGLCVDVCSEGCISMVERIK